MRPLDNIDGAVIFAPQLLEILFFGREADADVFVGYGDGAVFSVPKGGFVAQGVVNDERLRGEPPQEMRQDKFEDIVVGCEGGVKDAAFALHKAQKSLESVCFEGHFSPFVHGFDDGGVGKPVAHGGLALHDAAQVVERRHFARVAPAAENERNIAERSAVVLRKFVFHARAFFGIRIGRYDVRVERELDVFCGSHDAIGIGAGIKSGRIKGAFGSVGDIDIHNWPVNAYTYIYCGKKGELFVFFFFGFEGEQGAHGGNIFAAEEFAAAGDEMFCPFEDDAHFCEVVEVERGKFARFDDFIGAERSDPRYAQEHFEGSGIDFDGEKMHIF